MSVCLALGVGDPIVYFRHGAGVILEIETKEISGTTCAFYVIRFERDNLVIKVPVGSADLRSLSSVEELQKALTVLKEKGKSVTAVSWAKRVAFYEDKLNSGDLSCIAEVIRDVYCKSKDRGGYSYSERSLFDNAVKRFASEFSYVRSITFEEAVLSIKVALG